MAWILVGNSGVGKSYLANLLANENYFDNKFSARSVTHRTESIVCRFDDRVYRIYNIPGLIEGDQTRVRINREEIARAFDQEKQNGTVIIYIFGHENGRIRHEDVVSFQTMNEAYQFSLDSLLIIVNGLPSGRPKKYDDETRRAVIDLLGLTPRYVCFVDQIHSGDIEGRRHARRYLLDHLLQIPPRIHRQRDQIRLFDDEILTLKSHLSQLHYRCDEQQKEQRRFFRKAEQSSWASERVLALQRLFYQAKIDLHQLASLSEQEKHLRYLIQQSDPRDTGYTYFETVRYRRVLREHRQTAQERLEENRSQQRWLAISLDMHRKELEQFAYELKQIFDDRFDRQHEPCREYFILLDELRFDSSITDVRHPFVDDLIRFTRKFLGDID